MPKKILLCMLLMLPMMAFSQESFCEFPRETANLTVTQIDSLEEELLRLIDSMIDEGRYYQTTELMDSVEKKWKDVVGVFPSFKFYLKKLQIQFHIEDYIGTIKTVDKFLSQRESDDASPIDLVRSIFVSSSTLGLFYGYKGYSLQRLEEWQRAIDAYENANHFYIEANELGNQGDCFCDMFFCYWKLKKNIMARDMFEKGFQKYLDYFGTTRKELLNKEFRVKGDERKEIHLGIFSYYLFGMYLFESQQGNRKEMKDYLLMSMHTGYAAAKSEYKRIFGY